MFFKKLSVTEAPNHNMNMLLFIKPKEMDVR